MHSYIYVGTSSVVRVEGLTDKAGNPVTAAAVSVTEVRDARGRTVGGITLPLTLNALGGGAYEAEIGPLNVSPNRLYRVTVRAISGTTTGEWEEIVVAKRRRG